MARARFSTCPSTGNCGESKLPLRHAVLGLLIALVAACAPQAERLETAPVVTAQIAHSWAFETSDIPVDSDFRFGKLDNAMRYIVRHNATPEGTALVRMVIGTGSLDELDSEQGFAHFVEHMAFNGSKNVPEGEMIRLLERHGLAFGADTNASTGFETTTYKLDLPRNDPELLDIALMLMRETASELTISQEAVDRERGVVLAEMRDRNTYSYRETVDNFEFIDPQALYVRRFPIGTAETLNAASSESLRAFWQREYVPQHTTVIVIGDYSPNEVETLIKAKFADWSPDQADPQPDAGPVIPADGGRTDIYIDPALPERVVAVRNGDWLDEPDSVAQRQEDLLRSIGYDIVNRRFERLSRLPEPPFKGAGFGTGDTFKAGRATRLIVDTPDKKWKLGLETAVREYRRALEFGFSEAEVAEQVAQVRNGALNAAESAETRSHNALVALAESLIEDEMVPSHPKTVLERFEAFAPQITPESVLAALKREAVTLTNPLLRFRGRFAPDGGEKALRRIWNEAYSAKISKPQESVTAQFAYTDFGPSGTVVSDKVEPQLGIRTVRFANGVMLNLKQTDLEQGKVHLRISIDGGKMLNTKENPLATEMAAFMPLGGLGKHSSDELQSILAGRTVGLRFFDGDATFRANASTTPRDLEVQLELFAALITDPGYRPEGEVDFRNQLDRYFAQMRATPRSALLADKEGILSDQDPRFRTHQQEAYRKLTFDKLAADISERLANGAIEIGIVGDIDEIETIDLVARTFGALPDREPAFRDYMEERSRSFTDNRSKFIIHHTGMDDQALLQFVWPTRDDSDPIETLKLELLERVMRIRMLDTLREALGKAYSPGASSSLSSEWRDYGTFDITASVDFAEVGATRDAMVATVQGLIDAPVSQDLLDRARQPMLEAMHNALKGNVGWLKLVDSAQSKPDRIERQLKAPERLSSLTPDDIRQVAKRYLGEKPVEILVLPEGAKGASD